jgi:hypothetical protein
LQRSGGFAAIPGLSKPIVLDTAHLPETTAAALETLVSELAGSALPKVIPPPRGAADFRTLRLQVESPELSETWEFTDAVRDRVLSALIELVEEYV